MEISVWRDHTDPQKPWIVSRDTDLHSDTLYSYPRSRKRAIAAAKRDAKRLSVRIVIESPDGSGKWMEVL